MPKADRILANLPPTFRLQGDPSALRALVDAYGGELQTAENALVAVMRAHWAELADAGDQQVRDLARIAALYGLAPRPDESVEEFRTRLLRHVRTALAGTVTVQGILRVTAETLGLAIDDADLDPWWARPDPVLVTSLARGADAAALVLGTRELHVVGRDVAPATLRGRVDVSAGVDLTGPHTLWLALDGAGEIPIDLRDGAADPGAVAPADLVAAVEDAVGPGVARIEDGRLVLASTTTAAGSAVTVGDGPDDAAPLVLGLRPRAYAGADRTRARIVGTADLSAALDLTAERYLRLVVDGHHLAEVDCAARAADPASVDVGDVTDAINDALGLTVASDDGRFLTLTSPTPGSAGSIVLLDPAAQPATRRLLGPAAPAAVGREAVPARVVSDRRIGLGVDLGAASRLRLAVDAEPPVTVDVAGADPARTLPAEIVAAVNEALGADAASHDGDRITLVSPTEGAAGALDVQDVDGDAAEAVLGLRPRSAARTPLATARFTGSADLTEGVDLSSRHVLVIGVDGGAPVEVDLRDRVLDRTRATLEEIARAVNTAVGQEIASDDGAHLVLASGRAGAAGAIDVLPAREVLRRRFVTRARVTDDAAGTVLGFVERRAVGAPARSARLVGSRDLSGGVDLGVDRYLRLEIGDRTVEVDCAGLRPRVTLPGEVVAAITAAAGPVASTDGTHLVLLDPLPGADSRVALTPPRALDALDAVLGVEPVLVRGSAATGVRFTGTVDLSAGADLAADASLRIGVDDAPPLDVLVGDGVTAGPVSLSRIVAQIGLALGASVAAHDGTHLLLTSPSTGAAAALRIEVPTTGTDATAALVGVAAPRTYRGRAATPATLRGAVELTGGVDLRTAHLLRVAVDGGAPVDVDLTRDVPGDASAVDAATVAAAIRAQTPADARTVPVPGGVALELAAPSTGLSSRLELARTTRGDAATTLLGGPAEARGAPAGPATLDGEVDLLAPADLSGRSVLRLAVDGGEPVDVDVAGTTPSATLGGEVVAAIEAVLAGVAALGPQQRLRLTSPTTGPDSSVAVLAVRHLDLVEYPAARAVAEADVTHGATLLVANAGSAAVPGRLEVTTRGGVAGPRVADPEAGWSVRVDAPVPARGTLVLQAGPGGVTATVGFAGAVHPVDPALVHVRQGATPALTVRQGRQRWSWTECTADRFDSAAFDTARFAGADCTEVAVFDLSRFAPTAVPAVLGAAGDRPPTAHLRLEWDAHAAGAFEVHLPADLDRRFGQRFDEARFGSAEPQVIAGVLTEPREGNPDHILLRINATRPSLVVADTATRVPIGWEPVTLPFRDPQPLTLGSATEPARLYLTGPGLDPPFLVVSAAEPGAYGNDLTLAARLAGPEVYDLEVRLPGAPFESARAVVLGPPPPSLAGELLEPTAGGIGAAKAAGVRAAVTRDRVVGSAGPATTPGGT